MFKYNLAEGEQLLKMYRQTEMVLAKTVLLVFLLIYLPWYFLIKYEIYYEYKTLLLIWTLLVCLYFTHKFLLWLVNVYLITNKRLVIVEYKNLLHKKISESPLDRITNISSITKGLFPSLFRFGNVEVQVLGLADPVLLLRVAHPSQVKDALWHIHMQNNSQPTPLPVQNSIKMDYRPVKNRKIV